MYKGAIWSAPDGGAGADATDSKWKQQDPDHSGRAPDQRVQEHSQDLPIVAVFCQTDGVADEAARQEKELRHGLLPPWIVRVANRAMTRAVAGAPGSFSHLRIHISDLM